MQERFQVKNPPHTYIQKLRGFLDPAVTRKVHWEMKYMAGNFFVCLPVYLLLTCLFPLLVWLSLTCISFYLSAEIQKKSSGVNTDAQRARDLSTHQPHRVDVCFYTCLLTSYLSLTTCLSLYRWVREFLNEENRGLDVLVEYLSFAQYAVTWVISSFSVSQKYFNDYSFVFTVH